MSVQYVTMVTELTEAVYCVCWQRNAVLYAVGGLRFSSAVGSTLKRHGSQSSISQQSATKQR